MPTFWALHRRSCSPRPNAFLRPAKGGRNGAAFLVTGDLNNARVTAKLTAAAFQRLAHYAANVQVINNHAMDQRAQKGGCDGRGETGRSEADNQLGLDPLREEAPLINVRLQSERAAKNYWDDDGFFFHGKLDEVA